MILNRKMTKLATLKIKRELGINILLVLSLFFSLVSFGFPAKVEAGGASLYLAPANGTFFVGSTFDVSVFVKHLRRQGIKPAGALSSSFY